MYFEIVETYAAEIIDTTLKTVTIPLNIPCDKEYVKETIKLHLKNDEQGVLSVDTINRFLNFCEGILALSDDSSDIFEYIFNLRNIEQNTFVRTRFKVLPTLASLRINKENPNQINIVFMHKSSSVTNIEFKIGMSTFYFIFSSLINIRNYIDFNSLSFNTEAKNQLLKFKARIDKVFDELIVSEVFKGTYECRLARCVDRVRKGEHTVMSAIKNGCRYYGVKSYSMFTLYDYNFMLFEHNDSEETALFEYKFMSKIYDIEI